MLRFYQTECRSIFPPFRGQLINIFFPRLHRVDSWGVDLALDRNRRPGEWTQRRLLVIFIGVRACEAS